MLVLMLDVPTRPEGRARPHRDGRTSAAYPDGARTMIAAVVRFNAACDAGCLQHRRQRQALPESASDHLVLHCLAIRSRREPTKTGSHQGASGQSKIRGKTTVTVDQSRGLM